MDAKEGFNCKKLVMNVKQRKQVESCTGKISLTGVRREKNGRYGAQIRDGIRQKKVWLGTFDTIEEASAAYFAKKSEFENEKLSHIGNKKRGKYNSEITNPISKKGVWLGSFDNAEEASQAYQFKKHEFNAMQQQCTNIKRSYSEQDWKYEEELVSVKQGHKTDVLISNACNGGGTDQSSDASETFNSCLTANVYGRELSDECNTTTISCNPKAKRSFVGIKRQKDGRYAAVITDRVKHRKVWFGTFDTIEEASQAYFSKKSEFEKLSQQGNKENKPTMRFDQIQPESPVVETLKTASMDRRNKRINSQGKDPGSSEASSCLMTNVHLPESADECNIATSCNSKVKRIGVRKRKSGRYQAVITDPIKRKEVSLGTFDTIQEASQAYWSKKSEFQKLKQGNKENKSKKSCDQIQQPESPFIVASVDTADSASGRDKRIDSLKTTPRILGVYKSKKAGRYSSKITNPITKKKIWLGTFDTAEEASRAFQSKKIEFQKLVQAKQQQCMQRKSEKLVNVKQGHENVNCELRSSDGSAVIDVPFSNPSNEGTIQHIDSEKIGADEEALYDYQSKKSDLQSSKKVVLQRNLQTYSCAGKKQQEAGQEDDEDLLMGEWVQLPGEDRAVMFSLKLGLPIIDNYGYLLGEFSSLDDLSFV